MLIDKRYSDEIRLYCSFRKSPSPNLCDGIYRSTTQHYTRLDSKLFMFITMRSATYPIYACAIDRVTSGMRSYVGTNLLEATCNKYLQSEVMLAPQSPPRKQHLKLRLASLFRYVNIKIVAVLHALLKKDRDPMNKTCHPVITPESLSVQLQSNLRRSCELLSLLLDCISQVAFGNQVLLNDFMIDVCQCLHLKVKVRFIRLHVCHTSLHI
jgi:hypothetical protein